MNYSKLPEASKRAPLFSSSSLQMSNSPPLLSTTSTLKQTKSGSFCISYSSRSSIGSINSHQVGPIQDSIEKNKLTGELK